MTVSRLVTLDLWGLRKGVFYDRHPLEIPEGGAYNCSNVVSVEGYLRPRPGTVAVFPDSGTTGSPVQNIQDIPIRHIGEYVNFDNEKSLMVLRAPMTDDGSWGVLRSYNGASWSTALASRTPSALGFAVPGRIPSSSVNFKGLWFINNLQNDDDVYAWDGTTFSSFTYNQPNSQLRGPKGAKFLAAHPDRLIMANVRDRSNIRRAYRVVWSATLDPFTYRNENSSDVGSGTSGYVDLADESDPITALWARGDIILAFRARSIYQGVFEGAPMMYKFKALSLGAGCVSHSSLQEYRDSILVWLGDDNVYMGSPGQVPQAVGGPIQPAIRSLANLSLLDRAVGVIDRDYHLYHLFLPNLTNGNVDLIYTLNLQDFSWWPGTLAAAGIDVRCAACYRAGTWDNRVLLGGQDGRIYRMSLAVTGDKGTTFPAYWQSGILSVDRYIRGTEQASIQQLRAYASSGSIVLSTVQGDGLNKLAAAAFGTQAFLSNSSNDVSARPYKGEHVMIKSTWADNTTKIAGVSVGVIPGGSTIGRR